MFAVGLLLVTVGFSLYLWGMIRTAIWVFPSLFFPPIGALFGISLLGFWTLVSIAAPYQTGFFDLRDIPRNRWILIFLASGIVSGSILGPDSILAYALCIVSVPLILLFFWMLKQSPTLVIYLPKKTKWIVLGLWSFAALLRILESYLPLQGI